MRALVVYETLWGNTGRIAEAVAAELEKTMAVDLMDSDSAPSSTEGYDLVVVGGPTHAFSMSRPRTRHGAVEQNGAPHNPSRGIREWLDALHPTASPVPAGTFDTRVDTPRLPGSAAKAARHELRSLGFDVSTKAKSFRVHGYEGPLINGEVERAAEWAREFSAAQSRPAA
jgi:hypothetical protein